MLHGLEANRLALKSAHYATCDSDEELNHGPVVYFRCSRKGRQGPAAPVDEPPPVAGLPGRTRNPAAHEVFVNALHPARPLPPASSGA